MTNETMRPGEVRAEFESRLAAARRPRPTRPRASAHQPRRTGLRSTWTALLAVAALVAFGAVAALGVHQSQFELDENAWNDGSDDWEDVHDGSDSALTSVFIPDPRGGPTDNIFTGGGSKDINDVSDWRWTTGNVPDKDDILDAFAAAYNDAGDLIIYFGLDRYARNGDAQVGFWFFQGEVGVNADGTFAGTHQVGDLLVLSDFTNGGNVADIKVYEWVGTGGAISGTLNEIASGVECEDTATGDNVCAEANEGDETSPWPFTPKQGAAGTFPPGSFYEGGLNVTALGLDIGCGGSFLAETRTSQSPTAQLKDFALGSFDLCSIEVTKSGDELSKVGDPASYTVTIENTGAITVWKDSIVDDVLGDVDNPANPLLGNYASDCGASLAAGATCTITFDYTVQAGDADPLVNEVTATYNSAATLDGSAVADSDTHSLNLFQPGVEITKTGDTLSKVGDTVTYTFSIDNTSSEDSPNLILDSLTDTVLGDLTGYASYDTACDELAWDESCSFSVDYTIQPGDPDPLGNTVTVHYHPSGFPNDITDSDSHSVNLFQPSVTIDKTGDPLSKVGDDVSYTITVENTSSADSPNLTCTITDAMLGLDKVVNLAPGASDVTNETYTVQAGDSDPLENTASVTCTVDGFGNVIGPETDTHTVELFQPAVEVVKGGPASASVGDTVTYTFDITNLSTDDSPDLILVSVTDDVIGDLTALATAAGCDVLAWNGSCNFTADYTIQAGDPNPLVNVVDVLYNPEAFPNEITDSDDHSLEILEAFEGCTPGFWRNHTSVWDEATDALAIAAGFDTTTSFNAFFGLTPAESGFADTFTMEDAVNAGGGGASKLARHGVSSLLNVAAGINYQLPPGVTTYQELVDAIRDAYLTGTFEPLASQLAASNSNDHQSCPTG